MNKSKKVLILNRRCLRHPQMGGAEVYTWEMAKALKDKGFSVVWFSSKAKDLNKEEMLEGVRFFRKGNEFTTHFYGFVHALRHRRDYSLIIDEFNGVGFGGFLFKRSVMLIHQLYDEFWEVELGSIGKIFKRIERFLLLLYRKKPVITVSLSTKNDLVGLGFKKICIAQNGLEVTPLKEIPQKNTDLTLMFLGRLKKTKKPEDAIRAFLLIKKEFPEAVMYIVGDGPIREELQNKYATRKDIVFTGFLDNEKKFDILRKAHFLLVPGVREGWGQVVIQANASGTPVVGYDIPGLRDSIKDGETGFLVKDYHGMARAVIDCYRDARRYETLCVNALKNARNFSWEKSREKFLKCLRGWGLLDA